MAVRKFKYASPFLLYAASLISFNSSGWLVWLPMIYAWMLIPLLELFLKPDEKNMSEAEEEMVRKDPVYDLLLYAIVLLQYAALVVFPRSMLPPTWQER